MLIYICKIVIVDETNDPASPGLDWPPTCTAVYSAHTHSLNSVHTQFMKDLVLLRGSARHPEEVTVCDYTSPKHMCTHMYNVCAVQWTHNSCTYTPERIAYERIVKCTRTYTCTYPYTHILHIPKYTVKYRVVPDSLAVRHLS